MNYYSIPALVGFLINFYLFCFVLFKKADRDFKINFLIYLIGITGYCFAEFFQLNLKEPDKILFFLRLLVILLYISVPPLLIIIVYLINRQINRKLYYMYLLYLPLPYFLIRPDLVITEVKPIFFGYHGEWGIITKFIGFFSLLYLPFCIYFLVKSYIKNKNDIYLKKPYFLFMILLGSSMVLFWFILLMQGVFKNFSYRIGTFSGTLTISGLIIFYLIYHFKFLNIQIILRNILNYATAIIFVCISILVYLILYVLSTFIATITLDFKITIFISVFIALVIHLIFKQKILEIARARFYKEEESFTKNFINYIEPLFKQKSEQGIINKLAEILKEIFKIGGLRYIKLSNQKTKLRKFFENNDFLELNPFEEKKIISEIGLNNFNKLRKQKIRLLFALRDEDKLKGIICIKDKTTGEVFSFYEITLIRFTVRFISLLIRQLKLFKRIERQERDEFRQKIISIIMHDLKNIISSLEMSVKNIHKYFHHKEFRQDLEILFSSTLKKIEQIEFKLTHIEKEKLNKVLINPSKVIKEIVKEYSNYDIRLNLKEKKELILFDKEKFIQMIKNLIINAIESGELKRLLINIKTFLKGDRYVIAIKDNGKGMSKEFIKNSLFKPFTTTKSKGLGLGLYNCREILKLHNGEIDIKSSPGRGTDVVLSIPIIVNTKNK